MEQGSIMVDRTYKMMFPVVDPAHGGRTVS